MKNIMVILLALRFPGEMLFTNVIQQYYDCGRFGTEDEAEHASMIVSGEINRTTDKFYQSDC